MLYPFLGLRSVRKRIEGRKEMERKKSCDLGSNSSPFVRVFCGDHCAIIVLLHKILGHQVVVAEEVACRPVEPSSFAC